MANSIPNKEFLRGILLQYYKEKKSAAAAHRLLVKTYEEHAFGETTCRDWYRRFKRGDFGVKDQERSGAPKKFLDSELEALLLQDPSQTREQLAETLGVTGSTVSYRLKAMGMVQRKGSYELKSKGVEKRQKPPRSSNTGSKSRPKDEQNDT